MSTNGLKTSRAQRGSAAWLLLVLLVLGIGLFAWMNLQEPGSDPGITRDNPNGAAAPNSNTQPDLQAPTVEGIAPSGRVEAGPLPYREMKRVFDGTGQISGQLFPSDAVPLPDTWTLIIEPSQFALGRETAIRKELEFPGQQTTFEVRDLPMASYRVLALAEGQASVAMEVSLFKLEGPGNQAKDHSHIMLRMQPLSSLRVTLQTADLAPATDLPLTLESSATRKRWEAKTDAVGRYEFERLPAGRFTLLVGYPDQPLIPAETLMVEVGKVTAWQGTLPSTHRVTFKVVDGQGRGLPGAILRGHGGAPIDGVTDYEGLLTQAYLPEGTYRIRVEHKDSESHGRMDVTVPLDETNAEPVVIYCRQ
ncbi:MAG: carboxypeptidase-like regulatory domain-containing protein [Planctomycetota bacterium]|nr:carboxypeptidase-like regulatory domain-containing protein [Planctomycetota bacterium]